MEKKDVGVQTNLDVYKNFTKYILNKESNLINNEVIGRELHISIGRIYNFDIQTFIKIWKRVIDETYLMYNINKICEVENCLNDVKISSIKNISYKVCQHHYENRRHGIYKF